MCRFVENFKQNPTNIYFLVLYNLHMSELFESPKLNEGALMESAIEFFSDEGQKNPGNLISRSYSMTEWRMRKDLAEK